MTHKSGGFSSSHARQADALSINVVVDEHTFVFGEQETVAFPSCLGRRLKTLPALSYSDHEIMLIRAKNYYALSYNITDQFLFKRITRGEQAFEYFNNGFMKPSESDEEYLVRLERILVRLSGVAHNNLVKIICIQELPRPHLDRDDALLKAVMQLFEKYFSMFRIFHEGYNLIMVHEDVDADAIDLTSVEFSSQMLVALTDYKKAMAVHLRDLNLVIINQHASWMSKESERPENATHSAVIADLNRMLNAIAQKHGTVNVEIYGDFNREDYKLADERRTIDIRVFANYLALDGVQTYTSNSYTNIRYIAPHRNEGYVGSYAGVLTTSDYFVCGRCRYPTRK